MKRTLSTLVLLAFIQLLSIGQELHTPAEILQIMEKSPVVYEIKVIKEEILAPNRSENLNFNQHCRVIENGNIITKEYEVTPAGQEYFDQAEKFFGEGKISSAREMYQKSLVADPKHYKLMTYIGQTYGIEHNWEKAIEWYLRTIKLNYIDYMAHWFIADAYKEKGEIDKAVDEITIAKILNRNNPRIQKAYDEIYKLKKLKTVDWVFNPQMKIDSVGENKISIAVSGDWMGYALAKATWKYEPGYSKSMGVGSGTFSTLEEKESFMCLYVTFDKKKLKKYPEFNALQAAVENKMVDEYIFYEVILPDHPYIALQLSEEFINYIKDYVILIRGEGKKK